ncbi:hypothetical protein PSHT_10996 [Puccinia striiformis]|uniref:Uncharacterized protein n=2 Tax=Puccinia striiformis TaxID=27350 RepID=A0A0L0VAB2_9BASI|nr:hypothetical protein Pst134EB_023267 [Puccinia striiformis f. sp. tritici]KNE96213.1 hypothetical protein PSTG_10478 [Puccinia striiformis f. sp. tritici PST-78]POW04966.1 hypothetical protein PSHT_10996 [Puccinia striiformis]
MLRLLPKKNLCPIKNAALLAPPTSTSKSDHHEPEDAPQWKEDLPFIICSTVAQVLNVDSDDHCGFRAVLTAKINCSDKPVRRVPGPACPSSSWTRPSDKRSDTAVQADAPAYQLLEQTGPTRGRTAKSKNCSDEPVQGLIGPACPSN